MSTRPASHSKTWYSSDPNELLTNICTYITPPVSTSSPLSSHLLYKSLIAPHAGFRFSGPVAGFSFQALESILSSSSQPIRRIFILGPSHYLSIYNSLAVTSHTFYETPLGSLSVDRVTTERLIKTINASSIISSKILSHEDDSNEHSIEMHLPFIAHLLKKYNLLDTISIVPVLIGQCSNEAQDALGQIFSKYIIENDTFFCVSSDFCHFGQKFKFQPILGPTDRLYLGISKLDKTGMDIIESQNIEGFRDYLRISKNTICGRYPILILLCAIKASTPCIFKINWKAYAQSERVTSPQMSSVSYASAVIHQEI
jgi:MEMO1 family protein